MASADAHTALVSIAGAAGLLHSSGRHSASSVEAETLWQHLFDSAAAMDASQVCVDVWCRRAARVLTLTRTHPPFTRCSCSTRRAYCSRSLG